MYELKDLTMEITRMIERMRNRNNDVLSPEWISKEIVSDHVEGDEKDFFLYNAYGNVRNEVRKQLNKFKIDPEDQGNQQLVLPGLIRVQQYYLVPRNGERCAVHVHVLTYEEVEAKCMELRAMSAGCLEHADELLLYWQQKRAA
jgi:hypothetical protein